MYFCNKLNHRINIWNYHVRSSNQFQKSYIPFLVRNWNQQTYCHLQLLSSYKRNKIMHGIQKWKSINWRSTIDVNMQIRVKGLTSGQQLHDHTGIQLQISFYKWMCYNHGNYFHAIKNFTGLYYFFHIKHHLLVSVVIAFNLLLCDLNFFSQTFRIQKVIL